MRDAETEITALKAICADAEVMQEGGLVYAFLPRLRFRLKDNSHTHDALLCPSAHSGYDTRLFFEQPVPGFAGTWYAHQILSRQWHTISWRGVAAEQSWTKILAEHLGALA